MKANNIAISIPNKGCDKHCPYCISLMTGSTETNSDLFISNIRKARYMAMTSGVSSVSITGKGEPLLNKKMVLHVARQFYEFPIELQTNGILLRKEVKKENFGFIEELCGEIDIFAISCDTLEEVFKSKKLIETIHKNHKKVRITFNVTDEVMNNSFDFFLEIMKRGKVDQFSFRRITKANYTEETDVHKWIDEHGGHDVYERLINEGKKYIQENNCQKIRNLSYGAVLYDIDGISYTYFDYCIQDTSDEGDVRSLIYQEDGHLYTTWNSPASIVF